jgi:transposase
MPWKESSVMDQRLHFVSRLLEGEQMSQLCREFGISRKTGYKIFERYKEHGHEALTDRSRRPVRYANQLPHQVETAIVNLKRDKPHWGARKIREILVRRLSGDFKIPAKSTIHAVLDRQGLVKRSGPKRHRAQGTGLSEGQQPNDLWCADYKGEFKLGNNAYCYPLTVTDYRGLPEVTYPFHDKDILVTACGRICLLRKRINLSTVFAGQTLGIKEVEEGFGSPLSWIMIWDTSTWNKGPCSPSKIPSARDCNPCLRYELLPMCPVWTPFLMADRVGFEPTEPLQARRISSAVPSTTRPPVRRR